MAERQQMRLGCSGCSLLLELEKEAAAAAAAAADVGTVDVAAAAAVVAVAVAVAVVDVAGFVDAVAAEQHQLDFAGEQRGCLRRERKNENYSARPFGLHSVRKLHCCSALFGFEKV